MTASTLPAPSLIDRIAALFGRADQPRDQGAEDASSRRAFISEMIDRNPDAFASEQDVQAAMHCFPGRF